jgi:MFS family permease
MEVIATAFYVIFVREQLHLNDSALGVFTIATVLGGIIGIAFFGWLGDRYGTRAVIWLSVALQVLSPALALAIAALPAISKNVPDLALYCFIAAFAIDSAVGQAGMLGFQGYPLDAAPERHRAMYIGVLNSVGGVVALTPVLGGLMLDTLTSSASSTVAYSVVFGIALACVAAGLLVSFTLPKPVRSV